MVGREPTKETIPTNSPLVVILAQHDVHSVVSTSSLLAEEAREFIESGIQEFGEAENPHLTVFLEAYGTPKHTAQAFRSDIFMGNPPTLVILPLLIPVSEEMSDDVKRVALYFREQLESLNELQSLLTKNGLVLNLVLEHPISTLYSVMLRSAASRSFKSRDMMFQSAAEGTYDQVEAAFVNAALDYAVFNALRDINNSVIIEDISNYEGNFGTFTQFGTRHQFLIWLLKDQQPAQDIEILNGYDDSLPDHFSDLVIEIQKGIFDFMQRRGVKVLDSRLVHELREELQELDLDEIREGVIYHSCRELHRMKHGFPKLSSMREVTEYQDEIELIISKAREDSTDDDEALNAIRSLV